jgi:hypothetical protein
MAGKYGSASVSISYDDAPGGSLQDVSAHVLSVGGLKIEQITEENSPFGQAYESNTPVGKQKFADVTIAGNWDTSASTGPHVVFGTPDSDPNGSTRTLTIVPGDSKTLTVETRLVSYEVILTNGKLSGYSAVVRQAGSAAWA